MIYCEFEYFIKIRTSNRKEFFDSLVSVEYQLDKYFSNNFIVISCLLIRSLEKFLYILYMYKVIHAIVQCADIHPDFLQYVIKYQLQFNFRFHSLRI